MYEYKDWKNIYLHKRRYLRIRFSLTTNTISRDLGHEVNPIVYIENLIKQWVKPRIRNLWIRKFIPTGNPRSDQGNDAGLRSLLNGQRRNGEIRGYSSHNEPGNLAENLRRNGVRVHT
ncbi:hypothetical protein PIROE2DRAFT_10398 [Piromyces sp. E2]|nr:hypothetical protein PIROE2DRAFT_10398 [Piromyces sp. E2]|eukprot:OUM63134.1 hypothetical protein PIROE2DRAFT_10398 [Piromyces sp. E2]